jgi:hypothetical protein
MASNGRYKFLLATDSSANPRGFPASMRVGLEETYPYLLRETFKGSVFYQLSFGNITTEDLLSQPMSYLTHWDPDFIIVQSGLADCRPEAFSDVEKRLIERLPGKIFGNLKRNIQNPTIVKRRQITRVPPDSFRKTLKKFKMIFSKSTIYWLEICAAPAYEKDRPGICRRLSEYNEIINEIYGDGFVPLQESILRVDGFNLDHQHWLRQAHRMAADELIARITAARSLQSSVPGR